MNQLLLAQARKGIQAIIDDSPETISISGRVLTDDGFGGTVPNPYGTQITESIKCRISHESRGPDLESPVPPGISTNLSRYILVNHKTVINKDDTFEAIARKWKIGQVDPLKKFGGVIGYQAPLFEVGLLTEGT